MGVAIIARRGSGTHPGEDVIDPLIVSIAVALERGRNELDEQSSGLQDVDLEIPFRVGLRIGQVAKVQDSLFGTTWFGKIVSLSHTSALGVNSTSVRLRRPTGFTA